MRRLGWVVLALVAAASFVVVGAVAWVGVSLPVEHRAQVELALERRAPAEVYALIRRVEDYPRWREDVARVEWVDPRAGLFREHGDEPILFQIVEDTPPSGGLAGRLVVRVADEALPFGGRWVYQVRPRARGTTLVVTEEGEIHNPVFRALAHHVFGLDATLQRYADAVARELGDG